MHILIIGGAGMVGRKLLARLARDGALNGRGITQVTVHDVVAGEAPAGAAREHVYRKIHGLLAEDLPYVFLYYPDSLPTVHKRFRNVEVAPAGLGWNFREWYVPKILQRYRLAEQ